MEAECPEKGCAWSIKYKNPKDTWMRKILGLHLVQKHEKSEAEAKEYVANEEVHVRLKSTVTETFYFDQRNV